MKVLLFMLTFVVIWRWLCANPLPCVDDKCLPNEETAPVHVCSNPDHLHRSQRSILETIPETASNVTAKPSLEKELVASTDMSSLNSNKTKHCLKNKTEEVEEGFKARKREVKTDKEVNVSVSNNQTHPADGNNYSSLDKDLSEQNDTAVLKVNLTEAGTTTELKENLIKSSTSINEDLNNQTNKFIGDTKLQQNTSEVAENATALSDGTTKKENGNQADVTSTKPDKKHHKIGTEKYGRKTGDLRLPRCTKNQSDVSLEINFSDSEITKVDVKEISIPKVRRDILEANESVTITKDIVEERTQTKKCTNHSMAINKTLEISQLNPENQTPLSDNSTRTKRNSSDDSGDSRYILVHDVPPFKRKRAADDKNITFYIQTLVHGLRLKRETLNSSESESDTVETQNTSKISHHHHHSSKREANYDQENISCCLRQTRSTNKEEAKNLTLSGKSDTKEDESNVTTTPRSNIMEKTLNNTNNDEPESPRKVRSEDNISRKLLAIIEVDEVVDLTSGEEDFHLPDDTAKSDLQKSSSIRSNFIREFEPPFSEANKYQVEVIEENQEKPVSKDLKHVRCACAMFFDEPDSKDKVPLISESLLDYTDRKAAIDKEMMCSKACSEMSQAYFKVRQVVLCTHVTDLHHELQAIIPLDHSPEDDDDFDVISCQVIPGDAKAPLQFIVSWLNIIIIDVVICLIGLGIVCMYLICFVCRRRRGTIHVYSSASFTVK